MEGVAVTEHGAMVTVRADSSPPTRDLPNAYHLPPHGYLYHPDRPAPHSWRTVRPAPFLRPTEGRITLALVFLVLAALATLAFPHGSAQPD